MHWAWYACIRDDGGHDDDDDDESDESVRWDCLCLLCASCVALRVGYA